jgi:hypothetical protein
MSSTKEQLLGMVLDVVERLEGRSPEDPQDYEQEEGDLLGMFLDDILSIETIYRSPQGEYQGAEVLWTYGGPGIYIDTKDNMVTGYWGSDRIERCYDDRIGLDEYLEEAYGECQ